MKKLRWIVMGLIMLFVMQETMAQDSSSPDEEAIMLTSSDINGENQNSDQILLSDLLSTLEQHFDVTFLYKEEVMVNKYVPRGNIEIGESTGQEISHILNQLGIAFQQIDEQTYVLLNKEPSLQATPVQEQISGTVTDAQTGETLPGVNILVKETSTGASTDQDGYFELKVPSLQDTLIVTYIGYQELEVPINGQVELDIQLSPEAIMGEEMVVVGYGTTRKENLTGSVSNVDGEDLENISNTRVDQILQGRASGVQVTRTSGEPGSGTSIRIRGGNSIQGNNEPLWVIDGVIVGQDFNLNNINSNDIESIDILKDASAVSIYGTRGANGVILVTTKSGEGVEAGITEVSFNTYAGIQIMAPTPEFLNGPQLAEYANEDARQRGAAEPFSDPNNVPNVDWIDQVSRDAPIYNFDLSLSGKTEDGKINYLISGNHLNQNGVIRSSGIKKNIYRANLDYNISDKVMTGFKLNLSRIEQENNKVNISELFERYVPVRAIYNEDGNYTAENPVSASLQPNGEAEVQLKEDNQHITNLMGSAFIEYQPMENLLIRSSFSPEINEFKRNRFNPGQLPENLAVAAGGDAQINSRSSIGILNENTVNYSSSLGLNHELDILGGFTWQTLQVENNFSQAYEFSNDVTGYNNLAFGSNPNRHSVGSGFDEFQLVSWLGRANYSFKNKYNLTAVGRLDGSSRFADGNKYGFFPSAAISWTLSEESFIQDLNTFDLLKLRFSIGKAGSQAIPSYRTLGVLNSSNTTFNGSEQAGVVLGRPFNKELTWETTSQYDIGLEAAFFNHRLSIEVDYYNKKTRDLLLDVQIPRQTGFVSQLQNLGEVSNKGVEFLVNTSNISRPNFAWSSMLTVSGNRNEVLDLGDVNLIDVITDPGTSQGGVAGRLIVGETAPVFVGVEYLGTWKSQSEIDESGQTGEIVGGPHFRDTNGDGQINEDDFVVLGSPEPDFIYGFQNTLSYRNWNFDFFFQGTYGNDVFNELTTKAFFGRAERNKYAETLDRWTPDNPDSDIPRAGSIASLSEIPNNSEQIEDGSHIRLKNIRLSYNIPVEKLGLNSFKNLNVYLSGSNLFVLSNFRLYDPETSMFGRDNVAGGFSRGEYPNARTVSVGIKATL